MLVSSDYEVELGWRCVCLSCYIVVGSLLDSAKSSLEAVMYREVSVDENVRSLRWTLGNLSTSIPYFCQQKTLHRIHFYFCTLHMFMY